MSNQPQQSQTEQSGRSSRSEIDTTNYSKQLLNQACGCNNPRDQCTCPADCQCLVHAEINKHKNQQMGKDYVNALPQTNEEWMRTGLAQGRGAQQQQQRQQQEQQQGQGLEKGKKLANLGNQQPTLGESGF